MRKFWQCVMFGSIGLMAMQHARAQSLPDQLKGRWVTHAGDCTHAVTIELGDDTLRLTDPAGQVDTQHVTSRRSAGIATATVRSTHNQPVGKAWVWEVLTPGRISVTEGPTGRSATLVRCADLLPADATPRQVIETIYARYAASDEPNLPLSSEANVRAFFVAGLADEILALASRSGRLPDDCRPADPFVPDAAGDGQVTDVRVEVPPVADGVDHTTSHASYRKGDTAVTLSVLLNLTPAGWRIADVVSAAGRSFQASMAACVAPVK